MPETKLTIKEAVIDCTLIGCDGNAFALMGHWQKCARRQNVSQENIERVLNLAQEGDYDNLLSVLMRHCINEGS